MALIYRILAACVAGVVAWLICVFVGGLVALTNAPIITYAGHFLVTWAVLIGILVALWVFVAGWYPNIAVWRHQPRQ